jgi:NAD-dependent dihydropyrimidine dehydrogenase PreA subunit
MTYVIGKECIDAQDRACVDVCPVDCIYEGPRKNYINPLQCIDCGECEVVCPQTAIFPARKARTDDQREFAVDNAVFFSLPLAGMSEALGSPIRAELLGPVAADTPLVAGWPRE